MNLVPGNSTSPTVSGRPPASGNSYIQHYNRPGNIMQQETRTLSNGTTLTFGPADVVSNFAAGDPFYEQAMIVKAAIINMAATQNQHQDAGFCEQAALIDAATTNMVATQNQHQDAGYSTVSGIGTISSTASQHDHEDVTTSSLQSSFTGLSIGAASSSIVGHQNVFNHSDHHKTGDKPQNFAKGFRKGRNHGQSSNSGPSNSVPKVATGNFDKQYKKANRPGSNHAASHNSDGVAGPSQLASHAAAQGRGLVGNPSIQPGLHYSSFGAGIPGMISQQTYHAVAQGPAPTFIQVNQHGNYVNAQYASQFGAQGPAQHHIQMNQPGNHMNVQYASQFRVQGPAQPNISMNQSSNHFNAHIASQVGFQGPPQPKVPMNQSDDPFNAHSAYQAGVQGPAQGNIQMNQSGSSFSAHYASSFEMSNPAQSISQISQSGLGFETQAAAMNFAAQNAFHLNWTGPTLPAPPMIWFGISFNPQMAYWSTVPAEHNLHDIESEGPEPFLNYYELRVLPSHEQKDWIMAANGIRLPATYIPDPRYYHGPLYLTTEAVEEEIVNFTEAQYPKDTFNFERSELANETMLSPFVLPPYCYMPGTPQALIHASECHRHMELMQEVLAVPGDTDEGEASMRFYRIFGEPRLRLEQPTWHPHVVDLYGPKSQYEQLLVRDVNHRNDNEKGVGRKDAPVILVTEEGAAFISGAASESATAPAHQQDEHPSVFVRDNRTPPPNQSRVRYVGYRMRIRRQEELNPEISPTPPSRGRSSRASTRKTPVNINGGPSATKTPSKSKPSSGTKEEQGESSASKTPLLDFDSDYTARFGDEDEVDFAVRDMGAPRMNGMTFNEAIGYTPSPGNPLRSSESVFYPMFVPRRIRD